MTSEQIAAATYTELLRRRREIIGISPWEARSDEMREINRRIVQLEQARISEHNG